jgi:hypothetical protein
LEANSLAEADKQELHQLVESLPIKEIVAAKRFLEFLLSQKDKDDPLLSVLMDAPEDDEPLDVMETASIRESMRDIARGDVQPLDEVKKELEEL